MRIGIVTQYYPPEIGAPQARLSQLAERMAARGHAVFVLTAMPSYPVGRVYPGYRGLLRREILNGVRVLRSWIYPTRKLGIRRWLNYLSFLLSSLSTGLFLLPRMDYLITESPPLFLGISGYLLSRAKRARWVFNVSDLWPDSAVDLGVLSESGLTFRGARLLEEFCYSKSWMVSGQSKEILRSIETRCSGCSTFHLSNGVDTTFYRPGIKTDAAWDALRSNGETLAIYAGLHGLAQGLDQLLYAADQLRDVEGLRIVLVGDGPDKQALGELAASLGLHNVLFLPPVTREQMPSLLASADIALVPLKRPIFGAVPSKLYEAMGMGLPVVLIATGEAAHILAGCQAGLVVTPGDIPGLAEALRRLAAHPDERRQMGSRGRAAALANYDRIAITDAFIDMLEREKC